MDIQVHEEDGEYFSDEYDYYDEANRDLDQQNMTINNNNPSCSSNSSATAVVDFADQGQSALDTFLQSNANANDRADNNVIEDLAAEAAVLEGPAVHNSVAKLVNNHLDRDFRKSTQASDSSSNNVSATARVLEKLSQTLIPENLPLLQSCRVNEGMFKAMTAIPRKYNGELRLIESATCKAMVCQAQAMEKLLNLKSLAAKSLGPSFDEVFKDIATSIEFSAFGRAKVNSARREIILDNVNDSYKHLSRTTVPAGGLLFGDDLQNAMKSVESSNRLSVKLSDRLGKPNNSGFRPFLGQRGRFRGRPRSGYHPYTQARSQPHYRGKPQQHR